MDVDLLARWVAGAGVGIGLASLGLTWYLWTRSGPVLSITATVAPVKGTVHIEVASVGRLPATVRAVELRDEITLKDAQGRKKDNTQPISRWSEPAAIGEGLSLPVELAPTSFLEADVTFQRILELSAGVREVTVRAWAQQGDGRWVKSKEVGPIR